MTKHAIDRCYERCIPAAFGIRPQAAIRKAQYYAPQFTEALLVLAHSSKLVQVGSANGHNLCALVRDGEVKTFLLRRDGQSALDNLPIVRV